MSRKDLTRYNLLAVGAIAAPMLLVGLGPSVIGAGPGLSMALGHKAGETEGLESAALKNAPISPKRKMAMDRVAALRGGAVAATPFRPEPAAAKPVVETAPAEPVAEPAPMAKPDVVVKMIMRGGGASGPAARALIGGKICSEGDSVGEGWTIQSIDAEARSVTFASSDGQTYTVNLK